MVSMTLEEAEGIAREEPAVDELAKWRASMPKPEPVKPARGLDTAPAPQVDWSAVIRGALKAERALLTEATGGAVGEACNEVRAEFEAALEKVRVEMRAESERLRAEFSTAREIQTLRTELAEIKALLTARSRKPAAPPQTPAAASSNGDARPQ
jgi:hypothetical protein